MNRKQFQARDRKMAAMYASGCNMEEVAASFGCTRQNVSRVLGKLGVATRPAGRRINRQGYVLIWEPEHPNATKRGYVLEHRKVMAERLGRTLSDDEHVHHVNGVKDDNRPENLEVVTASEHIALHKPGSTPKWSDGDLLDHLRRLALRLGRTPTLNDMNAAGAPRHSTYCRRFGGIRKAQRAAGLVPNDVGTPGHGCNDLPRGFRQRFQHLVEKQREDGAAA